MKLRTATLALSALALTAGCGTDTTVQRVASGGVSLSTGASASAGSGGSQSAATSGAAGSSSDAGSAGSSTASASGSSSASSTSSTSSTVATPPKGGDATGNGLSVVPVSKGKTRVDLYVDFQCPFCKMLEDGSGDAMLTSAKQGKIDLRVHLMTFLDDSLGNDSSKRAANAFFCAADAGHPGEFMHALFAAQPEEGKGYTAADFTSAAKKAGISGAALTKWSTCTNDGTYSSYVTTTAARSSEVAHQTPYLLIDGKAVSNTDISALMKGGSAWTDLLSSGATAA